MKKRLWPRVVKLAFSMVLVSALETPAISVSTPVFVAIDVATSEGTLKSIYNSIKLSVSDSICLQKDSIESFCLHDLIFAIMFSGVLCPLHFSATF